MMKRCFLVAACGAIALYAAAPFPAAYALTPDVGPQISLQKGQSLSGRFVHEHPVEGFAQPLRTEGHFTVGPSNRIVWAIEKPMMTTTTITDDGLTQSVGGYTLLKMTPQQMPFLAEMQQKLLWAISGDWERLKPDFTITAKGTQAAWTITITPKEGAASVTGRKPFQKIVAQGSKTVDKADIVLPSGTVDHVTFSDTSVVP